jgi:hypothetical protein
MDIVQAITKITDVIFEDVPHPSDALEFGTKGISLRAMKR